MLGLTDLGIIDWELGVLAGIALVRFLGWLLKRA